MKRFTICIITLLFQVGLLPAPQGHAQQINAIGRVMPADAAPLDQQTFRFFEVDGTYMEWFKTIYKRSPATDLISEPLVLTCILVGMARSAICYLIRRQSRKTGRTIGTLLAPHN